MDGERRWSGSEFQTTGAAIKKLRLPSLVVLVRGRNRYHARPSGDQDGRNCQRLCRQCCWSRQSRCLGHSQKSVQQFWTVSSELPPISKSLSHLKMIDPCRSRSWTVTLRRQSESWSKQPKAQLWESAVITCQSVARQLIFGRMLDKFSAVDRWQTTGSDDVTSC